MELIAFGSIIIISLLALGIRTKLKWAWICPICVGTLLTWVGLLVARSLGYTIDPALLALLMGGSVVGAVFTFERKLPAGRSGIAWKMSGVPVGFVLAYAIVSRQWLAAGIALVAGIILAYCFFRKNKQSISRPVEMAELKEKMKNCC